MAAQYSSMPPSRFPPQSQMNSHFLNPQVATRSAGGHPNYREMALYGVQGVPIDVDPSLDHNVDHFSYERTMTTEVMRQVMIEHLTNSHMVPLSVLAPVKMTNCATIVMEVLTYEPAGAVKGTREVWAPVTRKNEGKMEYGMDYLMRAFKFQKEYAETREGALDMNYNYLVLSNSFNSRICINIVQLFLTTAHAKTHNNANIGVPYSSIDAFFRIVDDWNDVVGMFGKIEAPIEQIVRWVFTKHSERGVSPPTKVVWPSNCAMELMNSHRDEYSYSEMGPGGPAAKKKLTGDFNDQQFGLDIYHLSPYAMGSRVKAFDPSHTREFFCGKFVVQGNSVGTVVMDYSGNSGGEPILVSAEKCAAVTGTTQKTHDYLCFRYYALEVATPIFTRDGTAITFQNQPRLTSGSENTTEVTHIQAKVGYATIITDADGITAPRGFFVTRLIGGGKANPGSMVNAKTHTYSQDNCTDHLYVLAIPKTQFDLHFALYPWVDVTGEISRYFVANPDKYSFITGPNKERDIQALQKEFADLNLSNEFPSDFITGSNGISPPTFANSEWALMLDENGYIVHTVRQNGWNGPEVYPGYLRDLTCQHRKRIDMTEASTFRNSMLAYSDKPHPLAAKYLRSSIGPFPLSSGRNSVTAPSSSSSSSSFSSASSSFLGSSSSSSSDNVDFERDGHHPTMNGRAVGGFEF